MNSPGKGTIKFLLVIVVAAILVIGVYKLGEKKGKNTAAVASASASANVSAAENDNAEAVETPEGTPFPIYPESTTDPEGRNELIIPTPDASLDRAEADKHANDIVGGHGPVIIEAKPFLAVKQYLDGADLFRGTSDNLADWEDTDLSYHADVDKKFNGLHRLLTDVRFSKTTRVGDYIYPEGKWVRVQAFVSYDGTTSTIHSVMVDTIPMLADHYIDSGLSNYLYS